MASHSPQVTIPSIGSFFDNFFDRYFFVAFFGALLLEIGSFLAFEWPVLQVFFFLALCALVFFVGLRRLDIALFFVFADLVIDSKGALFSLPLAQGLFPIRLGLFLAVFAAWFVFLLKHRSTALWPSRFRIPFFVLLGVLLWGVVLGVLHHNSPAFLFFDANGYLFFALILPVFDAFRAPSDIRRLLAVLFACVSVSFLKTLFVLFVFSQELVPFTAPLYTWIRTSGVGEIAKLNVLYRVFFQSHIYHLFFFFLIFSLLIFFPQKKLLRSKFSRSLWWRGAASLMIIFISYSRSFWLAAFGTVFLALFFLLFFWKFSWKKVIGIYGSLILTFVLGYAFLFFLVSLPLQHRIPPSLAASALVSERSSADIRTEPAGSSRKELFFALMNRIRQAPVLGSGFGTLVTYKTSDPRALGNNPDGMYTTYAFEWGYLDIWVKMGMIGIAGFALLFFSLFREAWFFFRNIHLEYAPLIIGIMGGVMALILTHVTTPYINHPLGIGWILFAAVSLDVFARFHKQHKAP